MGQKVNPHGLRVGVIADWDSKWYAESSDFANNLVEDYNIRKFLKKKLYAAGVSKIEIERASDRVKVIVYTAKPGVVIGKGGAEIEVTKKELSKLTDKKVLVDIKEIKKPDKDAQLVAENIAQQLENRVSFRRAMKSCMSRTMKTDALGIKACAREQFLFRHSEQISTMVLLRLTQLTEKLVLRYGSTRVKYLSQRQLRIQIRKGAINNVNAKES